MGSASCESRLAANNKIGSRKTKMLQFMIYNSLVKNNTSESFSLCPHADILNNYAISVIAYVHDMKSTDEVANS